MSKLFLYFICLVSALGGLLFGYDWVVIGGAKPFYEVYFGIASSPSMQGLAMSIALAGCLVGATTCGALADRLGRKPLLLASAALFLCSAWATGAVHGFGAFLVARAFGGVAIGLASGVSPMYIAEVAPAEQRGRLVAINQLTIVLGILAAQIVNMLIAEPLPAGAITAAPDSWNVQAGWRWMFWAAAFPAAAFLVLAAFIPESPRFRAMKEATERRARGEGHSAAGLFAPQVRSLLALGVVVAVFQQWCGTNVIFNYAQEIFTSAGYDISGMFFNIVLTGLTNVVFTVVGMLVIDRWGRRALMRLGAAGLAAIYLTLGACYAFHLTGFLLVALVIAAIACYAMTLAPCTWVLISELFPDSVRGAAVGVCTFALWAGSCTLTYSFPLLNSRLGASGTFWIYAAICAAGFLFFTAKCPETKGRALC